MRWVVLGPAKPPIRHHRRAPKIGQRPRLRLGPGFDHLRRASPGAVQPSGEVLCVVGNGRHTKLRMHEWGRAPRAPRRPRTRGYGGPDYPSWPDVASFAERRKFVMRHVLIAFMLVMSISSDG